MSQEQNSQNKTFLALSATNKNSNSFLDQVEVNATDGGLALHCKPGEWPWGSSEEVVMTSWGEWPLYWMNTAYNESPTSPAWPEAVLRLLQSLPDGEVIELNPLDSSRL